MENYEFNQKKYENLESALRDLLKVDYVNLKADDTEMCKAQLHAVSVMAILNGISTSDINDMADVNLLSLAMRKIGCVSWQEAAEKYKDPTKNTIGELINIDGSIEFPLCVYGQILNAKDADSVRYSLDKAQDAWIEEWLDSQKLFPWRKPQKEKENINL